MLINKGKLDELCANKCISRTQAVIKAECSYAVLSRIRDGKEVTPKVVGKIARALNVEAKEIVC